MSREFEQAMKNVSSSSENRPVKQVAFFRVIGQWLDSDYRRDDLPDPVDLPEKVNWERTLPFIVLHLGCLGVIGVGM